ncbi:MAG TPA: hypothetical protein VMR65_03475 [Candidatus Sulfotelmatobacter sp.]|jgi:hypothetical protein|nr:hypothetical protein [Candidatus Sulfotelmatobacter sp.]
MKDNEIDRALSGEADILPSSGFARSVMEAVVREAQAPPPIPFPWRKLVPATVVGAVGFGVLAWAAWSAPAVSHAAAEGIVMPPETLEHLTELAAAPAILWTSGVLALTLASVALGARVAGMRSR